MKSKLTNHENRTTKNGKKLKQKILQRKEYNKCRKDIVYFSERYILKNKLYSYVKQYLKKMSTKHGDIKLGGARQSERTTAIRCFNIHILVFKEDIGLLSIEQNTKQMVDSKKIYIRILCRMENLFYKPLNIFNYNIPQITFGNNLICFASNTGNNSFSLRGSGLWVDILSVDVVNPEYNLKQKISEMIRVERKYKYIHI